METFLLTIFPPARSSFAYPMLRSPGRAARMDRHDSRTNVRPSSIVVILFFSASTSHQFVTLWTLTPSAKLRLNDLPTPGNSQERISEAEREFRECRGVDRHAQAANREIRFVCASEHFRIRLPI
jgi:hypothetical protein